jgi:hypothetical protein
LDPWTGRLRARLPLLVVWDGVVAFQGLFSRGAAVKGEKKRRLTINPRDLMMVNMRRDVLTVMALMTGSKSRRQQYSRS